MSHHSPKPTNLLHLLLGAALLAGLMFGLAPLRVAHAATFTVNTTADTTDANPGDGVCADSGGACSLRAAIREANSLTGADTITLPAGTYTLTRAGASENLNATGDLDIRSAITLNGAGASSTIIDANQLDRVFDIEASGATVVLDGITITNGKTPNADIAHCEGGGIYVKETTLTLRNSVVTGNTTGYHTGANWINMGCFGGGIYRGGSGTVTIENSTIRNNNAGTGHGGGGGGGGGVYNDSGNTIIRDSTLSSNASGDGVSSGDGDGGGIFLYGGSMTIQNSTLNGNTAVTGASGGNGGGIYASDSTVTIQNSTLSGNTAATDQGGGGLLVTSSATAYLIHSTVTGNAGGWGGGIDNQGTTTLKNSIIVGNDGNAATRDDCYIPSGTLTSQGYNLVGSGTGCPSDGTGDQSTTDARLGPLQDNGGPTQTHALLYNSPAVEVIPNGTNGCGTDYTTDQRGSVRPGGGLCDVGAYESPYIFWDGGGADNNTSTAANWSGDVTPAATDIPIFGSASSNNATINADLTVGGWLMEASYGGTISQGSYNLTVNGDWAQSGGTFTGGSGALDLGGAFNLSGGSFTAPSGLMTISGVFSHTGGSFAPSTGRVILGSTTNQTLATTFHDLVLNDGLLGYWKLDEGGGTTAYDASGYGYDGVLNNSPAWYTNVPTTMDFYDPYSLGFDRTSSPGYVAMSDTLKINAAQKLTLSTWVRLAAMPTGSGYTYMRFITLVGEKAVLRYYDYNGTDKLQFYMKIGGSIRSVLVNQTWATNTWYHVAG
ncbi:MAG: CSLREA domain-containing protein, partial [Chloroflexi bacterium]|nr:CSLREA domain-containing protein [Chloroflexota bacterium]